MITEMRIKYIDSGIFVKTYFNADYSGYYTRLYNTGDRSHNWQLHSLRKSLSTFLIDIT